MKIARILRIKHNLSTKPVPREQGQILILVAVAMVAILALMALAVDGGSVYFERRHAQNAADAAAMAGAVEIAKGNSNGAASNAAFNIAAANNYDASMTSVAVTSGTDTGGEYVDVKVDIDSVVKTSVAHMFGFSSVTNTSSATARVKKSGPVMPDMAIVAMGDCLSNDSNAPDALISIHGAGNRGKIQAINGGIFLNTVENSGNVCAIKPPPKGDGVRAENGAKIVSVGSYNYGGWKYSGVVNPRPVITGANGGSRINDPLGLITEEMEPTCPKKGEVNGGVYTPGRYGGAGEPSLGPGTLEPGIYCLSGGFSMEGPPSNVITGSGVVLYLESGEFKLGGNAHMEITAPTQTECPQVTSDPSNPCTFRGIAIFQSRKNVGNILLAGNGSDKVKGLVYALNGTVITKGSGNAGEDWVIQGQLIAKSALCTGNGRIVVKYDKDFTYWGPPDLSLYH